MKRASRKNLRELFSAVATGPDMGLSYSPDCGYSLVWDTGYSPWMKAKEMYYYLKGMQLAQKLAAEDLARHNDNGATFEQLADIIEEQA